MLRNRYIQLLLCAILSCAGVILLNGLTHWKLNHLNEFIRKTPSHSAIGKGFIKLSDPIWGIAGGNISNVFLSNRSRPNQLLRVNLPKKTTLLQYITGFDTIKLNAGFNVKTWDSTLYLFDGIKPVILTGSLITTHLSNRTKSPFFVNGLPISRSSYILKITQAGLKSVLVKFYDGKITAKYALGASYDSFFTTDGQLRLAEDGKKLFYTYYYRNRFTCLDTNLNVLYQGRTIDTVTHTHLKVTPIPSLRQLTLAAPPLFVNQQTAVSDRYLFIKSALRANNDVADVMKNNSVIDVYQISDGAYRYSLYIPNFDKEKLRDFQVYGKTLVGLYEHYLYFYQLNF